MAHFNNGCIHLKGSNCDIKQGSFLGFTYKSSCHYHPIYNKMSCHELPKRPELPISFKAYTEVQEKYKNDSRSNVARTRKCISTEAYYDELSNIKDKKYTDGLTYQYLMKTTGDNVYKLQDKIFDCGATRADYEKLCKLLSGRISVAYSGVKSLREFSIDKQHMGYIVETKEESYNDEALCAKKILCIKLIEEIKEYYSLNIQEVLMLQALVPYNELRIDKYPDNVVTEILEFIEEVQNETHVWNDVGKDIMKYCKESLADTNVKAFIVMLGDRL